MLGMNGTTARNLKKPRYLMQWVTTMDSETGHLLVVGYCVRDMNSFSGNIVFEHADKEVCEKVLKMILEGEGNGLSK